MTLKSPHTDVLPLAFFRRDSLEVARDLLGRVMVSQAGGACVRMIVLETEAYDQRERGAHCYGGRRTARTQVMFRAGGVSYVYFLYGMHWNFNVVTGPADHGQAVLIRAGLPLGDDRTLALVRGRRGWGPGGRVPSRRVSADPRRWCDGPAKLCQGMALHGAHNDRPLVPTEAVYFESGVPIAESEVSRGPRVGIGYAGDDALLPWRFQVTAESGALSLPG